MKANGIDPAAPDPVDERADDSRSAITLRQLLEMTSGPAFVEGPGSVFNDSSGTTGIISAICDRVIKANGLAAATEALLHERLFEPFEIGWAWLLSKTNRRNAHGLPTSFVVS